MELFIIGIVVALNIVIILSKFKAKRLEDGIFDTALLAIVTTVFSGSYSGLVVATVASLFISIYLYSNPPKFFSGKSGVFSAIVAKYNELKP